MGKQLTDKEIERLDPYQFMAALGKKVIRPGGKRSTATLYEMANFKKEDVVLDIGCGVGATAIDIAERYGCKVIAADIDPRMLEKARRNVKQAGLADKITVKKADIQKLPFSDNEFDKVVVEAVTMFVNRTKAIAELFRVCRPGGKVVEQEFVWRKEPTAEARRIFEGEVCPGIQFDTAESWFELFEENGFEVKDSTVGPFEMMSVRGFVGDEGIVGTLRVFANTLSRWAYIRKMMWLMPRIMKVKDSLGYTVFSSVKPN